MLLVINVNTILMIYGVHGMEYAVHSTPYNEQNTLYGIHYTAYIVILGIWNVGCVLRSVQVTMYRMSRRLVMYIYRTLYTVQCSAYNIHCTVYSVNIHCTGDTQYKKYAVYCTA